MPLGVYVRGFHAKWLLPADSSTSPHQHRCLGMSLPQKGSLVSNATRTYSLAVQEVLTLQKQPTDEASLQSMRGRLPYLRRLITCCACGGILDDAMVSACDHHYCFECQFKEPVLPIHCRQCRDRIGLVPALQLRTLVLCYHNLCHLLATFYPPGVAMDTLVVAMGDLSPHPSDGCDPVTELLKEARSVTYKCPPSVFRVKAAKEPSLPTGVDHSSAAILPASPCLVSKSEQTAMHSTPPHTQTADDPPLQGLGVRSAFPCSTSPPPGEASSPSSQGDCGVGGEARAEQRGDQGMMESAEHETDLPPPRSLTTSSGVNSINDPCCTEQPTATVAKRRKVNRSWK